VSPNAVGTGTAASEADKPVSVNITGKISDDLIRAIQENGGSVNATLQDSGVLNAQVPLHAVEPLATRPDVNSIQSAPKARLNRLESTLQNLEGDVAHDGAEARIRFKVDGSGVTICVLSDSVDHLGEAQQNGSLPPVEILGGQAGTGTGEGTAMLEIIHRLAPGATLRFATGFTGDVTMATNIKKLANSGCRIIVDDITYLNESPFQDGIIGQAVNDVSSKGILFFSAAGNDGSKTHNTSGSWEGDFEDGGPLLVNGQEIGRYHAFDYDRQHNSITSNPLIANPITGNSTSTVQLFWNDPLRNSTNEYDLLVIDSDGRIVGISNTWSTGANDPYQTVQASAGQRLAIVKKGAAPSRHLYIDANQLVLKYGTQGSTRGHNAADAENAFSIAALSVPTPAAAFVGGTSIRVADYSSDGPRRIYYNSDGSIISPNNLTKTGGRLLQKPDFTAADAVTTDVPKFAPFRGTSAAAPQAAGIAALLLSYRPNASPIQIRAALTGGCLDIEAPGFNYNAGAGILMPVKVLEYAKSNIPEQEGSGATPATSRQP
jgi:hypothetical protein